MAIERRSDLVRIGKFAESYNLTIHTIRHYMDMGLIIPEKQGGQYYFDCRCKSDLEGILSLKDMGFTLNEIKTIFIFRRLAKLTPYEENQYYKGFYEGKYNSIGKEIDKLMEIRNKLGSKIKELNSYENSERNKMGINLRNLDIFKCLRCSSSLGLSQGTIDNNQIVDGRLKCNCGVEYEIWDGILINSNRLDKHKISFDYNYIEEYINLTDIRYLDNIYKGMELVYKKIEFDKLENKKILELGTGMGFFLRHIYKDLPVDSVYIAIDNDLGRHKFLKGVLELIGCDKNIIFICSDFTEIPIEGKSIDILVDYSGTSNYSFENEEFLLGLTDKYVKESAQLIGAYILFKNFRHNSKIDNQYRKNFVLTNVKAEIKSLGYKPIYEGLSEFLNKGGKYEDYFVNGEEVYSYLYYGKR